MTTKHPTDAMETPEPTEWSLPLQPGLHFDKLKAYTPAQLRAERIKAYDLALKDIAVWIEPQRNDIPATGKEFADAIRSMKHEQQ